MALLITGMVILVYCWVGYPIMLLGVSVFKATRRWPEHDRSLSVTVIVAACNEEKNLEERIRNVFDCDWNAGAIEVLVVSDGSTDGTASLVRSLAEHDDRVKLLEVSPQQGRAHAHNVGSQVAAGDILVFTDAETSFDTQFIQEITRPFSDDAVAFTSGTLNYTNNQEGIAQSVGLYWKMELALRKLESDCGVFVFGSGACCAVAKSAYRDIPPTGDVDFTTPLDVALQGKRCVHCPGARAYDVLPESSPREFRARVRMTSKNLHGTISRWGIGGISRHPIYTGVILSHKIGKWLTPFFMLLVFVCSLLLASESTFAMVILLAQIAFLSAAILGALFPGLPFLSHAWSFMVANVAFGIGVCKAIFGRVPASYRPVSQSGPEIIQ